MAGGWWKKKNIRIFGKTIFMTTEQHPLMPFLPANGRVLMLGSFPPKRERWSMEFFYPNLQNDMWRIVGHIFFDNKHHFEARGERRFDRDKVINFCREKGIAMYDTACEVRRLKDNASDKFLEVVRATDIAALLRELPACRAIVTTGQKATDVIVELFGCEEPAVGACVKITIGGREYDFWRMPSSSRAYPMKVERKAEAYRAMFEAIL